MDTTTEMQGPVAIVRVTGDVNATNADELTATLEALLGESHAKIVIDCAELRYISSAGLRSLLGAMKAAKKQSGDLVLARVQDDVQRVLQISGFTMLLRIQPDVAAAVKTLG